MNTKILNPFTLPLIGTNLIEASAGTGKTYNIIIIYLRLLLGIGKKINKNAFLKAEQILVVTFTKSATEELKKRIINNIHNLKLACINGKSNNFLLSEFIKKIDNLYLAITNLINAEKQANKLPVYTIHGFCIRILNDYLSKNNIYINKNLVEDRKFLYKKIITDFWNCYFYILPVEIINLIKIYLKGPENLFYELIPYLKKKKFLRFKNKNNSIISQHNYIINNINNLKNKLSIVTSSIKILSDIYKKNYEIYNKRKISFFIKKINLWYKQHTINYVIPNLLFSFKKNFFIKKNNNIPLYNLFLNIKNICKKLISLQNLIFYITFKKTIQIIKKKNKKNEEIEFDELINYLEKILKSDKGKKLSKIIRENYPIAIIDEFQDVDPKQYQIFSIIYKNKENCGLILIGDPKQLIYTFRGADILNYISIKKKVNTKYNLNVNWRSSPGIIKGINQIFKNIHKPFIYNEIPFLPVLFSKKNVNLSFKIDKKHQTAICFWLQPGIKIKIDQYQEYMAKKCASKVHYWIKKINLGKAWLEGIKFNRLMKASDIYILIRNNIEAKLIRKALSKLMISSVYISSKKNIFSTLEAKELKHILKAILMPKNIYLLRRALSTNLIGFNASDIDSINYNKFYLEKIIEEFNSYYKDWKSCSIISMLYNIIKKYNFIKKIIITPNGNSKLINLIHLGELLQKKYSYIENEYLLINWFSLKIKSSILKSHKYKIRLDYGDHLVKIITIHQSKGLEFPIVLLPFISNFHKKDKIFSNNFKKNNINLLNKEKLSEDVRLLYVALTRSIYHCSIGIAPLCKNNLKKNDNTDFHLSALGYIIQKGKIGNSKYLLNCVKNMVNNSNGNINLCNKILTF